MFFSGIIICSLFWRIAAFERSLDKVEMVSLVVAIVTLVAIVAGVCVAWVQLRAMVKARRAEFLNMLDERFCTEDEFFDIRVGIKTGRLAINDSHREKLIDYLGFFEILDVFYRKGVLDAKDIYSQFGAYILEASRNPDIKATLREGWWSGLRHIALEMERIQNELERRAMQKEKGKGKK